MIHRTTLAIVTALLSALLGAMHSPDAAAHAVVTESSLQKEPVHPGHATTVALQFNAGVELALSRVFLVSKGDIHQPVPIKAGPKAGEVLVELPGLTVGEYAIKYKIFAADGHFTENVIRFNVDDGQSK